MKNSKQSDKERKTKKITLEVYEDSEATFYLALFRAKGSDTPKPEDLKLLLDSIHYPEEWLNAKEERIRADLALAWEYVHKAGKFSSDYRKISTGSFAEFIDTDFGKSLLSLYHVFTNLKDLATNKDSLTVKTELSLLSLIVNALLNIDDSNTNSKTASKTIYLETDKQERLTLEQAGDGLFKISTNGNDVNDSIEFQLYSKRGNEFQLLKQIEDVEDSIEGLYLRINDDLIKFDQDKNSFRYTVLSGVAFEDDGVNMTNCKEKAVYVLPKEKLNHAIEPSLYTNQFHLETPSVEVERVEISEQLSQPMPGKVDIPESLQEFYNIPDGVKKESYVRYHVITSLFNDVSRFFPDISQYVRSIVTGYLCVPLGIIDAEEKHNHTERTQSYHEHVGKTVRNVLASKPYLK
jgi:hypothetical protein